VKTTFFPRFNHGIVTSCIIMIPPVCFSFIDNKEAQIFVRHLKELANDMTKCLRLIASRSDPEAVFDDCQIACGKFQ
jgi:hypothetical protein